MIVLVSVRNLIRILWNKVHPSAHRCCAKLRRLTWYVGISFVLRLFRLSGRVSIEERGVL